MKGAIGITDYDWFRHLSSIEGLEECNFWQPSGGRRFRSLQPLEPYIFKLKKEHGDWVVGFGFFASFTFATVDRAWDFFGPTNGAPSRAGLRALIGGALHGKKRLTFEHEIGCILLVSPVFFPDDLWVRPPSDWAKNIVTHKTYDLQVGEGRRVWQECRARASALQLSAVQRENLESSLTLADPARFGAEQRVRPRLGQGTFRAMVENAYDRACAVTGEHTLPALDAAHIRPYGDGGAHEISNGLLLRADIHRLYDRNLVTVTPDLEFKVSRKLEEVYQNGKVYYALEGRQISLPRADVDRPNLEALDWHASQLVV